MSRGGLAKDSSVPSKALCCDDDDDGRPVLRVSLASACTGAWVINPLDRCPGTKASSPWNSSSSVFKNVAWDEFD